jgi:histidine triad (HIT) family protein
MSYDPNNIFAKILRGEIPCKKVYEDEYALAFYDIAPKAPIHVLVIPKGPYSTHDDFVASAGPEEIAGFERAISQVTQATNIDATGYRLISNCGVNGQQEVPHYHVHVLGGRLLGPMLQGKSG